MYVDKIRHGAALYLDGLHTLVVSHVVTHASKKTSTHVTGSIRVVELAISHGGNAQEGVDLEGEH